METARLLTERTFEALLRQALDQRAVGLVMMRCGEGLRHGVWVEHGYVVGAHVAGRFDPLLELLRRRGVLDAPRHRACLAALGASGARAGDVAGAVAGVARDEVAEGLRGQLVARLATLLRLAETSGHDARLERGPVPCEERSVRMPLGSLLRRIDLAPSDLARDAPTDPADARKRLRELARARHPDRHARLDPKTQQRLSDEFARATALYHGFG